MATGARRPRGGGGPATRIVGLDDLRRELRRLEKPGDWSRALAKIHRSVGKEVGVAARSTATSMGGPQKHFARSIRWYGTARAARIGIADPDAFAAFWGAKQDHTGWNAGNAGAPNQPRWVGTGWDVGGPGGPYALNETVGEKLPWIERTVFDELGRLTRSAFPDGAALSG